MGTKDLPREKIILIDNELSTIQNVEGERLRRFKEFYKIICYIAAFISIVFFVFLMIDVKKVFYRNYDTEASVSDDPIAQQTVIEQKVAELRGQVSLKKNI